jgi:ATP-dependent DNA helicase HFM1/MER3
VVASSVGLVLIDECHHIGDDSRGAILEAVISRMKTIHQGDLSKIRFVAVSATIPNLEDCARWLGSGYSQPATMFDFGAEYRPVRLCCFVLPRPHSSIMQCAACDVAWSESRGSVARYIVLRSSRNHVV